jgi:hypothetical protein
MIIFVDFRVFLWHSPQQRSVASGMVDWCVIERRSHPSRLVALFIRSRAPSANWPHGHLGMRCRVDL